MLDYLESFLYTVSVALFYPVLAGLAALILWTVVCLGGFAREMYERKKKRMNLLAHFKERYEAQIELALVNKDADIELTRLLRNWEKKQINKLDRVRFIIKTGPALGLIGTLIPMGIALASLSQGDMMAMSANMVTAFTTTIVGLACSTIAYLISMTKEKWLKAGFLECEIYCETLVRELERNQGALSGRSSGKQPGEKEEPVLLNNLQNKYHATDR